MKCCSQSVDTFVLSAVSPARGILFSIIFKCFPVYKIHGLRLSWLLFSSLVLFLFFFFPSLITTLLYSYSLHLILMFLSSSFYYRFFLSTVKINLFLNKTLVEVLGYNLLSYWHTLLR